LNCSSPGYAKDILLFSEISEVFTVLELAFCVAEVEAPVAVVEGLGIAYGLLSID